MTRTISSTVVDQVAAPSCKPVFLAQFEYDSSPLNLWTGTQPVLYNIGRGGGPESFVGAGDLLGVSPITETQQLRATGLDFSLTGINAQMLSIALAEPYQGRQCSLHLGFMEDGDILAGLEIFRGRMDVMTISEGGVTSSITVAAESILIGLEKLDERRWTGEDQKISYPTDLGFDMVPSLQQKEITWGKT